MRRRLLLSVLALVVLVSAAGTALYVFRTELVEALAKRELARRGLPDVRLTVEEASLDRLRITDMESGPAATLSLDELQIRYSPRSLMAERVDTVRLRGLSLRIDATGKGPPLGGLQPLLDRLLAARDTEAESGISPPVVMLENGEIEVLTALGPAMIDIQGRAGPRPDGGLELQGNLALAGPGGHVLGRLRGQADPNGRISGGLGIDEGRLDLGGQLSGRVLPGGADFAWGPNGAPKLSANLELEGLVLRGAELGAARAALDFDGSALSLEAALNGEDDGHATTLSLALDETAGATRADLQLESVIDASAPLWSLSSGFRPDRGRAGLSLRMAGTLAGPAPRNADAGTWLSWAEGGRYDGDIDLSVTDAALPDLAERLDARLSADLSMRGRKATLTLREDAAVMANGLLPRILHDFDLPPDLLGHDLTLGLVAAGKRPFALRLDGSGKSPEGELEGRAVMGLPKRGALSAEGRLRLAAGSDLSHGRVDIDPTAIEMRGVGLVGLPLGAIDLSGLVSGFWSGPFPTSRTDPVGAAPLEHALSLTDAELRFALDRKDQDPLAVEARLGPLRFRGAASVGGAYDGRIELGGSRVTLPDLALAIEGLSASAAWPLGSDGPLLAYSTEALRHLADPPLFNPIGLDGVVERKNGRFALTGRVSGPPGLRDVTISGHYDPEAGRSQLRAGLPAFAFAKGGPQPAAWSRHLEALRNVTGTIEGVAEIVSGPRGLESRATVGLADLSFEVEGATVEKLQFDLQFSDLLPPRSPPAQLLTIRRIEAAVPVEDVTAHFRVQPAEPPRILVEQAEFTALGGRYRVRDTLIDPARDRQELTVEVVGLDLSALLDRLAVEGLSASGTLDGLVPLVMGPQGLEIPDARLAATAPGVLRYSSATAAQALASGGESVALMLRALENFQYETLTLAADMNAAHETEVRISLLGKNPDVLDGHPFRFNINMSGNLEPIFNAIAQGYEISGDILRRSWRLGP